jgi:hypothetical protein
MGEIDAGDEERVDGQCGVLLYDRYAVFICFKRVGS